MARAIGSPRWGSHKWHLYHGAREHNGPESVPIFRFLAEDESMEHSALMRLLDAGDRNVIPRLTKIIAPKRSGERITTVAALYSAGETELLEELLSTLRALWRSPTKRSTAAEALGRSPERLKKVAAEALAETLLDRSGDVSEAAYEALCEMSGLEDLAFNPWADDAARKKQAGPLLEWVGTLQ